MLEERKEQNKAPTDTNGRISVREEIARLKQNQKDEMNDPVNREEMERM